MTYHRPTKRQLAYAEQLAAETNSKLPWGYQGLSQYRLVRIIHHLEAKRPQVEHEPDEQT